VPVPPRTRLRPEQRRAQLLDVAAALYAERGYEAVSLDDVAAAAGCSRQLVYHYFAAKRELLRALVEQHSSEVLTATSPQPGLSPLEQLQVVLDGYLDYVVRRTDGYRAMLALANAGDPEVRAAAEAITAAQLARVLASIPPAAATPAVALAVRGWLAFLRTATLTWLDMDMPITREQFQAMVATTLLAAAGSVGFDPSALT
jgi:AcrR family transcriptional regulator